MPLEEKYLRLIKDLIPCADESSFEKFSLLYDRVVETNQRINITSLTSPIDVTLKHIVDSLTLFSHSKFITKLDEGAQVCDIGCGGGFPGLPVACLYPETSITMIDSTEKKIRALAENAAALGLNKVIPVAGRGEELSGGKNGKYREVFDVCISRAVASLPVLCELCLPFVKKGGLFFALKGQKATEEIEQSKNAIPMLGAQLVDIFEINLLDNTLTLDEFGGEEKEKIEEFLKASRYLVVMEKKKNTNSIYPRKWSQITKKSL